MHRIIPARLNFFPSSFPGGQRSSSFGGEDRHPGVDDGVATGATVKASISTLKQERIAKLVVALPVASWEAEQEMAPLVDEWVGLPYQGKAG